MSAIRESNASRLGPTDLPWRRFLDKAHEVSLGATPAGYPFEATQQRLIAAHGTRPVRFRRPPGIASGQ